ncbi:MAG: hypothetical protein U0175_12020 [Caldilineaceae bacterium]
MLQKMFEQLVPLYSTPDRAYHNLAHIEACLTEFEAVKSLASDPVALQAAIWFHDVIYDPRSHDNEERSADFAAEQLRSLGMDEAQLEQVKQLILATKHDRSVIGDATMLVDIDLSILGKPAEEFDRYDAAIRQEYQWVAEDAYRVGRAKVLQKFLDRPSIYQTDYFRIRYEAQARINLQRAIKQLNPH